MELLYIWIEEYKNIKNQGFNFSPKYRFDYNHETKELTYKPEQGLPEDFFGKNITNVTAIIGENGSGKSSVLEFLRDIFELKTINFRINAESDIEYPNKGLIITQKNEIFYVEHHFLLPIIPNLKNLRTNQDFFIKSYGHTYTELDTLKHNLLYFSPILNTNHKGFPIDVSTSFLLQEEDKKNTIKYEGIEVANTLDSDVNIHRFQELKRQITFLYNAHNYNIPLIRLPKKLIIQFEIQHRYSQSVYSIMNKTFFDILTIDDIINMLCISHLIKLHDYANPYAEIVFDLKSFNKVFKGKDLLDKIKNYQIENNPEYDNISSIKVFIDFLIEGINKKYFVLEKNSIVITLYDKNIQNQDIINILTHFESCKFQGTFLNSDWDIILSSGEKFLLDFYSRFFSITGYFRNDDNLIVLVDEGEIFLHPNWQKKYVSILIDFLSQVLGNYEDSEKKKRTRKIQLILTSHSPFLVSDLPKENIIFLEKEAETGKCKVSKLQDRKETFGANIHTLFTDSFFMQGGLIGEFAEEKINEVIDMLNQTTPLSPEKIRYCEQIIHMIGEPIIKNMLRKLLDSKRLQKVEDHETRIKHLERELEKLRSGNRED